MNPLNQLISVKMMLRHVLYISYLVPASRIRPLVTNVLPLATPFPDQVFLSIVGMKCNCVRLSGFPWPSFDYDHLNIRTYVTDPQTGHHAVYFFRSGVSTSIVPLLTRILGIPWEKIAFGLQEKRGEDRPRPTYRAIGRWKKDLNFEIEESESSREGMEIFVDPESEITHITGPLIAFMKSGGHTIRFEISHLPLEVQRARLLGIRFQMPAAMGILKEKELSKPDSVLLVPRTEFTVHLPPPGEYTRGHNQKKIRRNVEMAALEIITAATLAGVFMGLASEVGYRIDLFSSNLFLIDGEFTLKKAGITGRKDMTIGVGIVVHLMTSAAFGVLYLILTRLFSLYTSSPKIIFLYVFFLWLAMLFIALPLAGQGVLGRSIGKSVWLEQLILHAIFGFGFWWALNTI